MASFSICETTSFEVQTRDIRIPLRELSITKQMLLLQFNVRMMYSTKEKSFSQRFHIRYLEKSEWSLKTKIRSSGLLSQMEATCFPSLHNREL